jgi:hypothetical protein
MNNSLSKIPNLKVENIGTSSKPLNVIKGFIELQSWDRYFLYDEAYKLIKQKTVTAGRIDLWVDGEITEDNDLQFSQEQINAYSYLVKHQEQVKQAIINKFKKQFPEMLEDEYGSWDHEESFFPKLSDLSNADFDFKDYIGPKSITISEIFKDEMAYIKWQFNCKWDGEHGFDVVTHYDRVLEIAPEYDPWKIYEDNGTYEQELRDYNERMLHTKPRRQKKWWQFW